MERVEVRTLMYGIGGDAYLTVHWGDADSAVEAIDRAWWAAQAMDDMYWLVMWPDEWPYVEQQRQPGRAGVAGHDVGG